MKKIIPKGWFLTALVALLGGALPGLAAQRPGETSGLLEPIPPPAVEVQQTETRALAYYHFTLGHMYERLAGQFRRSDYLRRAIEEYEEALKYDPNSSELIVRLAQAYHRSGRIRQAVLETKQVLEENPDDLAAHRLLGRIYYQTLGDLDPDAPPQRTLALAIEEYEHIARLAPDDTESLLVLARLHRMNNDLSSAEATLKKLLAVEPQSENGLAALAQLYSDQGEYQKAIELLQGAADQTPSSRVLASLAYAYEEAGDLDGAIRTYRQALHRDKEDIALRRRLADTLLRANRLEEALTEYRVVAEADKDDAETLLRLSQIYRHQRRFDEARAALNRAKELAPGGLEIAFNEALLEEAQGNFQAAIAVLSEMLARMTNSSGDYGEQEKRSRGIVLERLGTLYRQTENFSEAVDVFRLMLSLDESAARRGYAQMAETYRQARQLDDALATIQQALERFPDQRDLKLQYAGLLSERGHLEQAVQLARGLLTDTPDDQQIYLTLAQIYERHKRFPEAEAAVQEAEKLSQFPAQLEYIRFLRGALYERQKKYQAAEEQFRQVLEINPDSAITLNYLGYMFADQGMNLEESVELIQRALEIEPYNGAYLDSLGWAYFRLGQLDLAEKYLLQAVERLSRDPTIHDHLGDLYYASGRLRLALEAWERSRQEWQRTPATEFDAEAFARLEDKLQRLKVRLAQETKKKKPQPE